MSWALSRSNIVSSSQLEQWAYTYLRCIELHPLALEDVLANRGSARSKADYYSKHLSLRVHCHTVQSEDEESLQFLTKSAVEKNWLVPIPLNLWQPTKRSWPIVLQVWRWLEVNLSLGSRRLGEGVCGTTKPVEDEESAPVSLYRILQASQIIPEVSPTGKSLIYFVISFS